jgi:cardiolipin synthase
MPTASISAANPFTSPTAGQLQTLLGQSNVITRAFVKDRKILLRVTDPARSSVLEAKWTKMRVPAQEFSYAAADLEEAKPSRATPSASAREVKVISKLESDRLFSAAANRLVPSEPGSGIHCRYALGEAVLFRDDHHQVQLRSSEQKPAAVVIERRFSRQELASAAATELEKELRQIHPTIDEFVLILGTGSSFRFAYVHWPERTVVILYPPRNPDDAYHTARTGSRLSNLSSLVLVDHVWAFVKNPISSSARTLHQWLQWPLSLLSPRLRANRRVIPPIASGTGMDLPAWEQWLDEHTHTRREPGSLRLMIDGDQFFPLLQRRIAEAQTNVNIHVCIFDRDDVAVALADKLKQRSSNIEVKVVFDRLNSRTAAATAPATLLPEGFAPPPSIKNYLQSGSRVHVRPQPNPGLSADHSKLFLVDGRYAYIGGMNLGREYRYEWHDLMTEVQGPVVYSFQRQFDIKWAQLGPWGDCGLAWEAIRPRNLKEGSMAPGAQWAQLRRLYTKTFDRQIRQAELAAINRASKYIFAENPYFYSNELLIALASARLRGVDVRLVIPNENDTRAGHKSNLTVANYLLEHGVRVFFYPGMTHVKALLADGWACYGSANFDALSLRMLREADLATSDPTFAGELKRDLFEKDFATSRELKEPLLLDWSDFLADALLTPF